jgi:hypothetical protein
MKYIITFAVVSLFCIVSGCSDYVASPPPHPYEGDWYFTLNSSTSTSSASSQRNIKVSSTGSFNSITVDGKSISDTTSGSISSFRVKGSITEEGLFEGTITYIADTTMVTPYSLMITNNTVNSAISSTIISNPVIILSKTQ